MAKKFMELTFDEVYQNNSKTDMLALLGIDEIEWDMMSEKEQLEELCFEEIKQILNKLSFQIYNFVKIMFLIKEVDFEKTKTYFLDEKKERFSTNR